MKTKTSGSFHASTIFSRKLPDPGVFSSECILFYDSNLGKNPKIRPWINRFKFRLKIKAGEDLKSLKSLESILKKVARLKVPKSANLKFIAFGGGSVGDFVGFLASIYLRGRPLYLVPSTWLAAIDSSHGGKNGLNFQNTKNQLGTIYLPQKIYVCHEVLETQPDVRLKEAMGELVKIALLADTKLFEKIQKIGTRWNSETMFSQLPKAIDLKNKIVAMDPLEKMGQRRILNLGHTMGHVFEASCGIAHGRAVMLGIQFSLRWSLQRQIIKEATFIEISELIEKFLEPNELTKILKYLSNKKIKSLLSRDKKLTSGQNLDFIFIKKVGNCQRLSVPLEDILSEVKRQRQVY